MKHESKRFAGETIALDDSEFTNCTFVNCQISSRGVPAGNALATRISFST
jgi:hypothetical protein